MVSAIEQPNKNTIAVITRPRISAMHYLAEGIESPDRAVKAGKVSLPTTDGAPAFLLEAQHLSKSFGPVEVLSDVSVALAAGEVHAIVGENGAGKSTLVKLLAKMYEPTSGAIFVDETPLARVSAQQWRQRLAGAFQDFFRFE